MLKFTKPSKTTMASNHGNKAPGSNPTNGGRNCMSQPKLPHEPRCLHKLGTLIDVVHLCISFVLDEGGLDIGRSFQHQKSGRLAGQADTTRTCVYECSSTNEFGIDHCNVVPTHIPAASILPAAAREHWVVTVVWALVRPCNQMRRHGCSHAPMCNRATNNTAV